MTSLKIKNELAPLSPSADTFGISQNLWPQLKRLIQEAESLVLQAKTLIKSLEESIGNDDKDKQHNEFAKDCHNKLLDSCFYALICGEESQTNISEEARKRCKLFWNSLRVVLSDQFRGFAVLDDENRREVENEALEDRSGQKEPRSSFWKIPEGSKNTIGRIWFLVAYAKALSGEDKQLISKIHSKFRTEVEPVLKEECRKKPLLSESNDWHRLSRDDRFNAARRFAVWHLLNKYNQSIFPEKKRNEFNVPDNERLFQYLMLSRGAESALGAEISFLLRILLGRYFNNSPVVLESADTVRESLRYVLSRQNEIDGSWELPMPADSASLVLHRFSPLLHILDLDTELLQLEGTALIEACARALSSARRILSRLEADFRLGRKKNKAPNMKDMVSAIVIGLSLGATVYDRLKDILSDSILSHRGAVDGDTIQRIGDIPNSLNFRDNIKQGVIEPWVKRNSRRPGAILIYGPPGTGKTTVAKIIASELNRELAGEREGQVGADRWRFLNLSPADFAREGSDGIVACAERLFDDLKGVRRCVVLLDEMEEFLRARGPDSDRASRLITTAFLPLLQEAVKAREVILVVATNFVGNIDAAVTRQGRFDLILPLGPPDYEARKDILFGPTKDEGRDVQKAIIPEYQKVVAFLNKSSVISQSDFEDAVAKYSMGYARAELESFFRQLWGVIEEEVQSGAPVILASRPKLETELWRIRANQVPMALSGRSGSDWRAFEDEVTRYCRFAPSLELSGDLQEYWREPDFPLRRNTRDETS